MYKNWKAICQIPDTHMMWALALLDMNSDLGRRIVQQLPEYFTQEEQAGPYPLSLMRTAAQENGLRQGNNHGALLIHSFDGEPRWLPTQGFYYGEGTSAYGFDGPKLPAEVNEDARQGEVITWAGKQFVVLENNDGLCELWVAPTELVAVDR